ncbi:hypothetical protein PS712_06059 [Pseudomonas fluorescens]|uniref:Uncharacterized protein n=1 Tax=Pseudomonas fluorescens TaxID=294 RepID=A0A5E7FTG9_PSEFL|nr:hypothetical protein PS712_06059 [Pseudomonas fluorescens]
MRFGFQVHELLGRAQLSVLLQRIEQRVEIHLFRAGVIGIDPRQHQNFTDQCFEPVALTGQAWPEFFPFFRRGPFGQCQCNTQACKGRAQFVGDVPQQLPLAADQALQPRAHAVEVVGQHAEFIAAVGQFDQAVLLIGGLPQIMHRAAQTTERAGDGKGHQQAEQRQHHQRNAQRTQGPEQAFAVPGVEFRVGNAVDQQVGVAGFFAGVFVGQAAPWQAAVIVVLSCFERRGTAREGAADYRVAAFVEHLNVDVILAFAFLKKLLGRILALGFVGLGPLFSQGVEARVAAENPRILVEHVPQQNGQASNQSDGQPEAGQDTPEQ